MITAGSSPSATANRRSKKPPHQQGFQCVGDTGIEPVTSSVSGKRATAAPIAQGRTRLVRAPEMKKTAETPKVPAVLFHMRAVDEIRTRDIHLGKVVLYQLSYNRMITAGSSPSATANRRSKKPPHQQGFQCVGDTGIEPVTSSVSGKRATAAPIAQGRTRLVRAPEMKKTAETPKVPAVLFHMRAVDEIRTRDIHLGKVVLYQLSYNRMITAGSSPRCNREPAHKNAPASTGAFNAWAILGSNQ